jgi:hypothetical protein
MIKLTVTLHASQAEHYARYTGVTLHRCEVKRAGGVVEPARIITPDEAHELLLVHQIEQKWITCTARHGELPYSGSGPLQIDWPALHAAAIVVDAERRVYGPPL